MSYSWESKAEEGARAARVPSGEHRVRISKIVFGDKQGPFTSRNGDPQFMLVFQDREAREVTLFVTLSPEAAWVLARVLGACDPPVNLKRMEQDGVEPHHFADQAFAERNLLNRELTIRVEQKEGRDHPEVTPIRTRPTSPSTDASAPPTSPPAVTEAPPTADAPPATEPLTKDEAWKRTVESWAQRCASDPKAKERRNQVWLDAIRAVGKPESEFGPADWARVVEACSPSPEAVPF